MQGFLLTPRIKFADFSEIKIMIKNALALNNFEVTLLQRDLLDVGFFAEQLASSAHFRMRSGPY